MAPEFWADPDVEAAVRAWDLGVVVRLFRKHTGLSQASVARLVSIDQAEVSRLERGQKKIGDRRQLAQWSEALGVPGRLLGPLPDSTLPPSTSDGLGGRLTLREGPGQLLLPAGRNLPPTALPVLTGPATSFRSDALHLGSSREFETWSRMPLRALLAAHHNVDGTRRHFVMDAREGVRGGKGSTFAVPVAYELDDLTYGILWAAAGFDSAVLGDDAVLHGEDSVPPQQLLGHGRGPIALGDLTDGSQMLVGSRACAEFILDQRDELAGDPVFWTREQRGEEAATWLLFEHKHRYLQMMAPEREHSGVGRAFCIPGPEVVASPAYERVLLFLAIALMESYGVTTWLTDEPDLQQTDGFVLVPGHRAAIATWVRAAPVPQTAITGGARSLRAFADITGHAKAHTMTTGPTPGVRLSATADYLGLDRPWLIRRCGQLAAVGTTRLARPRSRHLSLGALDRACAYVAAELRSEAGDLVGATR
ncbi:helix-turn-helix transcriptional regulator [Streptomyces sp. CB03238]|uniref:helix-turn-helix domain-containing protein n=1 Tax=Streptomyces sp. CB03238 TaxID=1907777 RepID=UPI0015C478A9|nr:helix-turn-helix transcriptional regulator [Streptomyces sp. CB03238]